MLQGTIEAEQDSAARLANTDLSVVPDPLDLRSTSLFERGVIHWMIGRRQGREGSHATLKQAGTLGDVIMIAAAVTGGETLDFGVLREGLQYTYTCSRPLPADLDTLKARYGDYLTWPLEDLPCGATKDERRLVWTHPEGRAVVAETVTDAGEIRETEVLFLDLRDDDQIDFGAYDEAGQIVDRSTFATFSAGPVAYGAPYICISCHTDTSSVDVQSPVGLGAGCRG